MIGTTLHSQPASDGLSTRAFRVVGLISEGIAAIILSALRYVTPVTKDKDRSTISSKGRVLDKECAIKCIPLDGDPAYTQEYLYAVKCQLLKLNSWTHPHIVVPQEFLEIRALKRRNGDGDTCHAIGVVMERATQSLLDYLFLLQQKRKELPEDAARWWFQQLVLAVDHCHKRPGKQGNSIRPSNILVFRQDGPTKNTIQLSGLGVAQHVLHGMSETAQSQPTLYHPPEAFRVMEEPPDKKLGSELTDVWACGVTLFQMVYPNTFYAHKRVQQGHRWMEEVVEKNLDSPKSGDCDELLRMMLMEDWRQRATLKDVMDSAWFTKNLPSEAADLNERCLKKRPKISTADLEKRLDDIIDRATKVQLPPALL